MTRAPRGFSLIEITIASVMALVIVSAAFVLAVTMIKANRGAEAYVTVNARAALVHSFLERRLESTGHHWRVEQWVSATERTAAWGQGHCVASTGVCTNNSLEIFPLEICGPEATPTTCPAVEANRSDAVKVIVPRDALADSVEVLEEYGGAMASGCSSLSSTVDLEVKGVTTQEWEAGDILLLAKQGHVNVVSLASGFPADTSMPPTARTSALSIDVGNGTDLQFDDGGSPEPCNAVDSLIGARVFRVKQVILRERDQELQVAESATSAEAADPTWEPLVGGLDDLQFRLDLAHFPDGGGAGGAASMCGCDDTAVLDASAFGSNCGSCVSGQRLNGDADRAPVNRLVGLLIGVTVSAGGDRTRPVIKSWRGMFDRVDTVAADRKARRQIQYYVGFPNAYAF